MSITRRQFLRNSAAAGAAASVSTAVAVQAAEPQMSPRDQAIWHLKELERLILADGASEVTIIACGHAYGGIRDLDHGKALSLHPGSRLVDRNGMFAVEGGDA